MRTKDLRVLRGSGQTLEWTDIPITKQKYIKVDTQVDGEESTERQSSGLRCTKNFLLHCGKFSKDPS